MVNFFDIQPTVAKDILLKNYRKGKKKVGSSIDPINWIIFLIRVWIIGSNVYGHPG